MTRDIDWELVAEQLEREAEACPFCKKTGVLACVDARVNASKRICEFVRCENCGSTGPEADTLEEAFEKWNRR